MSYGQNSDKPELLIPHPEDPQHTYIEKHDTWT